MQLRLFGAMSAAALVVGLGSPAWADEPTPEGTDSPVAAADAGGSTGETAVDPERAPKRGIEEISITGRRREETVQQAPVSVTAFTAVDLEDLEITELKDLQRVVPNLQFDEAAGSQNSARVYFRGIGNGDAIITDEGGVGITVDDVFLPRAAGVLLGLSDVERVEVLAGPQATLYGKNTVGGLVRYLTKKPEYDAFSGRAGVRLGNYNQLRTELMLNVPLVSERLAMRMNLRTNYNEGLVKNRGPGRDRSLQSRGFQGQLQFRLQATDNLEILVKGYHANNPNTGFPAKCDLGNGNGANSIAARLFGTNDMPGSRGSFAEECLRDRERGPKKFSSDSPLRSELRTFGSSLHIDYSASPAFKFRSITAWNRNKEDNTFDGDATPLPLTQPLPGDSDKSTQDAISQEFNFSGIAMDGRMNWVAGVFGLVEKNQDNERDTQNIATFVDPEEFRFADLSRARIFGVVPLGEFGDTDIGLQLLQGGLPDAMLNGVPLMGDEIPLRLTNGAGDCIPGTDQVLDITADLSAVGRARNNPNLTEMTPVTVESCRRQFSGIQTQGFLKSNVTSYAAYGQLEFDLTEQIKMAAGARYTHERKRVARFSAVQESSLPLVREPATIARGNLLNNFEFSQRFGRFSPSLSLSYQPTDTLNLYLLWGRGFKSGGFNGRGVGDMGEIVTYDPEVVTNYEFGVKSQWFDRRLTLNGALFSTGYKDVQLLKVQINQDSGRIIVITDNVGTARINGGELSFTALPFDGFSLRGNIGITASRYNKVNNGSADDGFIGLIGPNARLTGTPTYTGSISASYGFPLADLGDLRSTVTWSHQGKKANNPSNSEFSNKFGLLSGRIALEMADGKTTIGLFGTNLLDREYVANSIDVVRNTLKFFGPPRQFGIEVTRNF